MREHALSDVAGLFGAFASCKVTLLCRLDGLHRPSDNICEAAGAEAYHAL